MKSMNEEQFNVILGLYSKKGYRIIRDPKDKDEFPQFLTSFDYYPSYIIKSDSINFVVELSSSKNSKNEKKIKQVIEEVENHRGWEFVLVVADTPSRIGKPLPDVKLKVDKPLRNMETKPLPQPKSKDAKSLPETKPKEPKPLPSTRTKEYKTTTVKEKKFESPAAVKQKEDKPAPDVEQKKDKPAPVIEQKKEEPAPVVKQKEDKPAVTVERKPPVAAKPEDEQPPIGFEAEGEESEDDLETEIEMTVIDMDEVDVKPPTVIKPEKKKPPAVSESVTNGYQNFKIMLDDKQFEVYREPVLLYGWALLESMLRKLVEKEHTGADIGFLLIDAASDNIIDTHELSPLKDLYLLRTKLVEGEFGMVTGRSQLDPMIKVVERLYTKHFS